MKCALNFIKRLFVKTKKVLKETKISKANLLIIRNTFTKKSTLGKLYLNGGLYWHTLELPYKDNQRSISCIPAGRYKVKKRSAEQSSKYKYEHLIVEAVPNRKYILFHIGNYPHDTSGCILIGDTYARDFIGNSKTGFTKLMQELKDYNQINLIIKNQ